MQKFDDSFEGPYSNSKKTTASNSKKTKIIMNISCKIEKLFVETQYAVVKHVGKKLKWNLSLEPTNSLNFDICWMDGHVRQ